MANDDLCLWDEIADVIFQSRERLYRAMLLLMEKKEEVDNLLVYQSMLKSMEGIERALRDLENAGYFLAGRSGPFFPGSQTEQVNRE